MSNETLIRIEIIKIMPFGLYYDFKTRIYASALDTEQKCLNYINLIIRENNDDFITELKKKNEGDFIRELESQYNYYYNKSKDCSIWIDYTNKLIRSKITDRFLLLDYETWYKAKTELILHNKTNAIYSRIFQNQIAINFFKRLQTMVIVKTELADYSFIYHKMYKDGFIYEGVKDAEFRSFLKNINVAKLERLKTLADCTTDKKEIFYDSTKTAFNLK